MLLIIENNVRKPNVGGRNVKQVDSSKVFRVPNQLVVKPDDDDDVFVSDHNNNDDWIWMRWNRPILDNPKVGGHDLVPKILGNCKCLFRRKIYFSNSKADFTEYTVYLLYPLTASIFQNVYLKKSALTTSISCDNFNLNLTVTESDWFLTGRTWVCSTKLLFSASLI